MSHKKIEDRFVDGSKYVGLGEEWDIEFCGTGPASELSPEWDWLETTNVDSKKRCFARGYRREK